MSQTTIEWCDYTFNPWSGCSKVSPGCANCYAEVNYSVKMRGVKWGPSGNRIVKAESGWKEPIGWDRMAKQAGERRRVFCASLADVFEDWKGRIHAASGLEMWVDNQTGFWEEAGDYQDYAHRHRPLTLDDVRARLFPLFDATPNLDWLVLTKRPENIAKMMPEIHPSGNLDPIASAPYGHPMRIVRPNIWLGVSVEDQKRADERIPLLLQTPAAVRFLSCEPLLGPINLHFGRSEGLPTENEPCRERHWLLDWVIVGGESGPGARQAHLEWFRDIIRQCKAANVPVFMKQTGQCVLTGRTSINGPSVATQAVMLKDKKGGTMSEWPSDLRIREFPK
jgi:protein gp37